MPRPRHPHEARSPTLSPDTAPAAEAIQLEILRRMTLGQKAQLVSDAIQAANLVAKAGLWARHSGASETEIHRRWMGLLHGEALATRIWGPLDG